MDGEKWFYLAASVAIVCYTVYEIVSVIYS